MAFTVDRFLAISSPLRHIKVKTPKRAAGIVGVIIGLSLLAAMDRLVDYYWFFTNDPGFGPLPIRPTYISEWRLVYSWTLVSALKYGQASQIPKFSVLTQIPIDRAREGPPVQLAQKQP